MVLPTRPPGTPARFLASVVGAVAFFTTAGLSAEPLPESGELAELLEPYLAKPLPSIETLVGVSMPPPSPLMVVASLGDDASQPDLESAAIENNPDAAWAKRLRSRWETWDKNAQQ